MIIVPINGDSIKTKDGLPSKILSFTNYKVEGPAVLVDSMSGQTSGTVFFTEIAEINDVPVRLLTNAEGYKVFETDAFVERKFHLPQIGEIIMSGISGFEERSYEVTRLRVHVQNKLAKGMIIDCQEKDAPSGVELTLDDINDIEHYLFNKNSFLKFYSDYRPKGAA